MSNYLKKTLFTLLIFTVPYMNSASKAMDVEEYGNIKKLAIVIDRSSGPLGFPPNSIDDDRACKIAKLIKGNQNLKTINLNHNKIGNIGIKSLSEVFSSTNLTQIHLYGNPIDDDGFGVLFPSLMSMKSLTFMDLRETKMGTKGFYMLSELLESNLNLKIHHPPITVDILDEFFKKTTTK